MIFISHFILQVKARIKRKNKTKERDIVYFLGGQGIDEYRSKRWEGEQKFEIDSSTGAIFVRKVSFFRFF